MTVALIQPSFTTGEITPSLFGRVDLAKWHVGCATMRNFFVNYRGGASSRAGTKFVGVSSQNGSSNPPRLIRFQFSLKQGLILEFGDHYMRVISNGAFVTDTPKTITGVTNTNPGVVTSIAHGFTNGMSVYIAGVGGMPQLNGNIYTLSNVSANTFRLIDLFGNPVDTSLYGAYTGGGTAAHIYTLATPYAASDLPALKFTQSADVMSFTHPLYPPYDLTRISSNNWTMAPTSFSVKIASPGGLVGTASTTTQGNILYVTVTAGGAAYAQPPRVGMTSATGKGAVLAATITGGAVVDIQVVAAGSGYQVGDTVFIVGGTATATPVIGNSPVDPTIYQYTVTAIDEDTGEESIASNIATVSNSVNISEILGTISLTWNAVSGADSYRIYKAPASFSVTPPVGSLFGYIGTALGNSFVDNNILPNFSITPPLYINPFAPGQILSVTITNQGSGYDTPALSITSGTGSGAVLQPVIIGGKLQAVIVINPGHDYNSSDTFVVTGGGGINAAGTLNVGPLTGTYPSCVAYFQQRRAYANTLNNPDTYFMSQPGAFTNFDVSPIPLDSNAVIGTPWAQQVNGIQALVAMPSGLIVLTGLGAWQVTGGGVQQPITPTSQDAQPQAYNGCSENIQPITVNYDVLYVQAKGSIVRDLAYNVFVNIYTGTDLSILSNHLFEGHQLLEWAWAEEPFKVIWAVRDDGILLSLTYLKEQDVQGWARHDTKGLFVSINTVTESVTTISGGTFVDVTYIVVKRYINGQWLYFIERMDPRIWNTLEDSWCLDAALALTNPAPAATLTASQSTFPGLIDSTVNVVYGGSGYTNPSLTVVDPQGEGSGAVLIPTVVGGIITNVLVSSPGSGYVAPQVLIEDSTGIGAVVNLALNNNITFTASAAVFTANNIGDVIRLGNGVAVVTEFTSTTVVVADLTTEITKVIPDDPNLTPIPAVSGTWSITTPVTTVYGLSHLASQSVKALADGNVVEDLIVNSDGSVTLDHPASSIVIGLPFQAQVQSLYTDIPGEATVEGKRKNIYAVTVRVRDTRGLKVGSNQVDASTQSNDATALWDNMIEIKERGNNVNAGTAIPLFTGDERVSIPANWNTKGQVAVQQDNPLPANILAFIPEDQVGDTNG